MTGANQQRESPDAARRSPVMLLLWLAALLSILQWTAPALPERMAVTQTVLSDGVGVESTDRRYPVMEASPAAGTVAFEKRSPGGRTLPAAEDSVATLACHPGAAVNSRAAAESAPCRTVPGRPAGLTFTARSPPIA